MAERLTVGDWREKFEGEVVIKDDSKIPGFCGLWILETHTMKNTEVINLRRLGNREYLWICWVWGLCEITGRRYVGHFSILKCLCRHHKARAESVQLFVTLWTAPCQALLSMGFFRQELLGILGILPFPPPGIPNPGMEPTSPVTPALVGRFFTTEPPGKPSPHNACWQCHTPLGVWTPTQSKLSWQSKTVLICTGLP